MFRFYDVVSLVAGAMFSPSNRAGLVYIAQAATHCLIANEWFLWLRFEKLSEESLWGFFFVKNTYEIMHTFLNEVKILFLFLWRMLHENVKRKCLADFISLFLYYELFKKCCKNGFEGKWIQFYCWTLLL